MGKLNVGSWEMLDYEDKLDSTEEFNLNDILSYKNWKKIVTHNPIGEYGHPQHKLIFESVKRFTTNFYVFGKSNVKLSQDILNNKLETLKLYKSEQSIINQIQTKKGDWFKSNSDTNYIEYESITKYNKNKDITPYIACYDK
jgi:LmbE family N-acetylglucosaminyl deacetylase